MLARCQHVPGVVPVRRFGGVHPTRHAKVARLPPDTGGPTFLRTSAIQTFEVIHAETENTDSQGPVDRGRPKRPATLRCAV